MACSGNRYVLSKSTTTAFLDRGNRYVLSKSTATAFLDKRSDAISTFNRFHPLSNPNLDFKICYPRMYAAKAVISDQFPSPIDADQELVNRIVNDNKQFYDDRMDKFEEWIRGSVTEIVKNIRKVPLLVYIHSNGEVKTEKAVKTEMWPNVITERSCSPDGIILVEQIKEEHGTKAFGVLVQGKVKGRDGCKSACYLLKTSSVDGLGFICSHYCLMKVKSFTESAFSQLKSCWLVE